jgi:hypothetical protein
VDRNGRHDMPIVILGIAAAISVVVILGLVLCDGRSVTSLHPLLVTNRAQDWLVREHLISPTAKDDPLVMFKNTYASRGGHYMGSSNPPETFTSDSSISKAKLIRQMSEVISLREKVAQAELAARVYGLSLDQSGEEAPPEK